MRNRMGRVIDFVYANRANDGMNGAVIRIDSGQLSLHVTLVFVSKSWNIPEIRHRIFSPTHVTREFHYTSLWCNRVPTTKDAAKMKTAIRWLYPSWLHRWILSATEWRVELIIKVSILVLYRDGISTLEKRRLWSYVKSRSMRSENR